MIYLNGHGHFFEFSGFTDNAYLTTFQASVSACDVASAFSIHELFLISIAFHNRNYSKVHIADLPYEYKYELSFVKETVIPYVLHTTNNWSRTVRKRRCEIRRR